MILNELSGEAIELSLVTAAMLIGLFSVVGGRGGWPLCCGGSQPLCCGVRRGANGRGRYAPWPESRQGLANLQL